MKIQDASWTLTEDYLPKGWKCMVFFEFIHPYSYKVHPCPIDYTVFSMKVCAAPAGQKFPSNFIAIANDVYTPDLIAASDCMLGRVVRTN
jgi:L-arabinokinase